MENLKQNYKEFCGKQIPNEWRENKIGDIIRFEGGSQPPKSEFKYDYEDGYVRLIQIRDYKNDDYLTYIPENLARKFCDETDIMIGRYGPPIFQILRGIKGAYNVALMKAVPDENKVLKEYAYYYLQLDSLFRLIDKLSRRSSGQTGVDLDALNSFPMPLPNIEEQSKIVKLIKLSEDMVLKQEQLIEKKKEFKKGLTQRLLSGEVRFKEFKDKWKNVKLQSIADIIKGNQFNKADMISDGIFPVVNGGIAPSGYSNKYNTDEDTITISEGGNSCGFVNFIREKFWSGGHCYTINPYCDKIDKMFLYHILKCNEQRIMSLRVGSGLPNIQKSTISNLEICIPELEEQHKIARIFNSIDKEIELLEKELEALKLQKKGLMQRLLTGEVRVKV